MSASNQIQLKGDFRHDEHDAADATIKPGMLLQLNSAGRVIKHPTAGGRHQKMFANLDGLQGNTRITAYTALNPVMIILPVSGSVVNARLRDGQDISIGDELVSNGDGTLVVALNMNSYDELQEVVGYAMEAVDLSGSASNADGFIACRVK